MDGINDLCYDEHVKSYQRYVLISWLESAKSERIKAVKDKIKIHSVKVMVPENVSQMVEIPEQTEKENLAFQRRFADIPIGVALPKAVVVAERTEEEKQSIRQKFDIVKVNSFIPQTVEIGTEVNKIDFPDIKLPRITNIDFSDMLEHISADKTKIRRS